MDYKKKYEELVGKIEKAYLFAQTDNTKAVLEEIRPILKEIEDERIKNVIYGWIYIQPTQFFDNGFSKEEMLAWLEKQGEQKPTLPKWRYKKDNTPLLRDSLILNKYGCVVKSPSGALVSDVWVIDYDELAKLPKEEFEKQSEQPQGKTALEAAKEEKVDNQNCAKPADKVEPKFKVGEWIVWENKCYKVNYNGCGYELIDQNGLRTSLEYGTVDTSSRLWDITIDAKDGDVLLASDGSIFIFKEVVDLGCKHYIALEEEDGTIQVNDNFAHCWETVTGVCPATKEQRDTLEKAMADAGYTFDFDKKDLKKIEQKPAEWSEEDKKKLNRIYMLLAEAADEHAFSTTCRLIGDKECVELQDFLRSLKPQPKQEWSEEDERNMQNIDSVLFYDKKLPEDTCVKLRNFLKSLKDRVGCEANCTTTWKPSDEQMKALNYVVNLMASSESPTHNDYYYNVFKDLRKQLKKLMEE